MGKGKRKSEMKEDFSGIEFEVEEIMMEGRMKKMEGVDKMIEKERKDMFGDEKKLKKIGKSNERIEIDKIEEKMMRKKEKDILKDKVRIGSEIEIGKKKKINEVEIGRIIRSKWIGYIINIDGRIKIGDKLC